MFSPACLCFLAKWVRLCMNGRFFKRMSLKNGGLKVGSGSCGPGEVKGEVLDDVAEVVCWGDEAWLAIWEMLGDSDGCSLSGPGVWTGDRKRLEMPAKTIPGLRPRNGESSDSVPRIRCLN
jgi:hypothetical protein